MAQISTKKSHLRHSHISPAPLTYLTCAISWLEGRGLAPQTRSRTRLRELEGPEDRSAKESKAADQAGDQEGKASHGIKAEDSKKRHQWISLVW